MNKSLCTPRLHRASLKATATTSRPRRNSLSYKERQNRNKKEIQVQSKNTNLPLTKRLQPQRILRRLPIAPNPLAARQILVLHIFLVALPFVRVLRDFLHAFGGFTGRAADGACDVADGGLEGFVEDLADWVADDAEETLFGEVWLE